MVVVVGLGLGLGLGGLVVSGIAGWTARWQIGGIAGHGLRGGVMTYLSFSFAAHSYGVEWSCPLSGDLLRSPLGLRRRMISTQGC